MRFPAGFPVSLLGLAAQVPLQSPSNTTDIMTSKPDYSFKEGVNVFSPKDLVGLARPGTGSANDAGDLVLVAVSKYSLEEKKNQKSIFIAPVESAVQPLDVPLTNGGEAFWLDSRTIAHAVAEGAGKDKVITLYTLSVKFEADAVLTTNFRYSEESAVLVFSDYVHADGNLTAVKENDEAWENRGDTAFVYDNTYERHWDTWIGPKTPSLFSVKLSKDINNKWILGTELAQWNHSAARMTSISRRRTSCTRLRIQVAVSLAHEAKYLRRATHAPVFSAQGDKVAWLELDRDGVESDRAKIVIYDLAKDIRYTLTQQWDRSPEAVAFSRDGKAIYITAGDIARIKIFVLPVPPTPSSSTTDPALPPEYLTPLALTSSGAASGVQPLSKGRLLFTRSSLTSPNDVFVLRGLETLNLHSAVSRETFKGKLDRLTRFSDDALEGKSLDAGEDFWFEEGRAEEVAGIDDHSRRPRECLEDQWSTRWNPNVMAQQGYVVIAINPTGSTTFGQELTDAIAEDWGGNPFVDLQKGWKYILQEYPEIDPDRAVAAGASYGGYAINWIQGHPEYDFGFKALVCHDGAFSAAYHGYSTDELFFFNHEWGGRPWEPKAREVIKKFDPINFVENWSTPMLVVHGSKDYRLPETDGIGAFHALQQLGVPSRLVIFPDENHWVLNHGNSLKWHYEVFRWFDKFVGKDD
ncbi:Dipeptidyl-peptidase 5 [Grifola frondosa]|uniref:Dipeptidyl-peptidase V n=1 Tax=Grifola frondosa TaxID=5627 RepID=A0A1C7M3P2_GRIFR|nr:Dipeptidyl-peptidase 5 [Grifola frondosa]